MEKWALYSREATGCSYTKDCNIKFKDYRTEPPVNSLG